MIRHRRKRCTRCKQYKILSRFRRERNGSHCPRCNRCTNEMNRATKWRRSTDPPPATEAEVQVEALAIKEENYWNSRDPV